jgi:hypothetical protein
MPSRDIAAEPRPKTSGEAEASAPAGILRHSMDARLFIHNAVIGLVHPMPPWPHSLRDLGYRLVRIEQPVGVEGGEVGVDLVLVAKERNAALAIECKEGTVQRRQAEGYEKMTATDLVQTGNVSLPSPAEATLGVIYAMPPEHVSSALDELSRSAPSAGVLEIGDQIAWHGPPALDAALRQAMAEPIPVDPASIPRLLLIDEASSIKELAGPIANALQAAIVQGRDAVTVASLIEMACWGWPNFGRAFQGRLARETQSLLRDAASKELDGVLGVEKASNQADATVRLHGAATASTQAGELRAQRAVRAKLQTFVLRVTGRPASEYPGQLLLDVSDAEFEDDLSDD